MGKTFRREKSFKPKRKALHNHRDLPDVFTPDPLEEFVSDPVEEEEAEAYYGKKLHPEKPNNE